MFLDKDLKYIAKKGISLDTIQTHVESYKKGIDFVKLQSAVTPENGIYVPNQDEFNHYNGYFTKKILDYSFTRFIPASGAASRMFKSLFEALEKLKDEKTNYEAFVKSNKEMAEFFSGIQSYPFSEDIKKFIPDLQVKDRKSAYTLLKYILESPGLNYGFLPKGLLKFHSYKDGARTAFEEHFIEASHYLVNSENKIFLHFTVSPEHRTLFEKLSEELASKYKLKQKVDFIVSFSEQKPSTDTIAVNPDNTPFRTDSGELLFRPGGHGALLENLNDLNEELVFIGNIDNIAPDRTKSLRISYKKLLGGILIEKVEKLHSILNKIENGQRNDALGDEIYSLVKELSPDFASKLKKSVRDDYFLMAFSFLNRPVRICGMVKNVGEPGGGPFWVKTTDGQISKQIIESSQINMASNDQLHIFNSATHFNPVDLACYIRDFKGNKFNLIEFRDPDMAFIAHKSQGGKDLKSLELPGLWNGSMAGWLTWFVDVPMDTFSPVKTVFDLVRKAHLS